MSFTATHSSKPLVVFTYSFSHFKSGEGLHRLFLANREPALVIGAPSVPVTWAQSKLRTTPKDVAWPSCREICAGYRWEYLEAPHASEVAQQAIKTVGGRLGLILGARILPKEVFELFASGVINLHPGALPKTEVWTT